MFAGLGMVVGNLISGKLSNQYSPEKVEAITQGLAMLTLVLFFLLVHSQAASLVLMFVDIDMSCLFAVSAPQLILLLQNSKGGEMLGVALVREAFNIGDALGANSGGVPINKNYPYEYSILPRIVLTSIRFILFIIYLNKNKTRQ